MDAVDSSPQGIKLSTHIWWQGYRCMVLCLNSLISCSFSTLLSTSTVLPLVFIPLWVLLLSKSVVQNLFLLQHTRIMTSTCVIHIHWSTKILMNKSTLCSVPSVKTLKTTNEITAFFQHVFSSSLSSPYHRHENYAVHEPNASTSPSKCEPEDMLFSDWQCHYSFSVYLVNCIVDGRSLTPHLATACNM